MTQNAFQLAEENCGSKVIEVSSVAQVVLATITEFGDRLAKEDSWNTPRRYPPGNIPFRFG
jgi:hypothetical protein